MQLNYIIHISPKAYNTLWCYKMQPDFSNTSWEMKYQQHRELLFIFMSQANAA